MDSGIHLEGGFVEGDERSGSAAPRRGRGRDRSPDSRCGARYRKLKPGPGRVPEEVEANQRARILGAMIVLTEERGYGGVTVKGLAEAAGVSKATFYELFVDKDACFLAAFETIHRAAARAVLAGERGGVGKRGRMLAGLRALADMIAEKPGAARLVLVDSLATPKPVIARVRERMGLFEALVGERLQEFHGGRPLPPEVVKAIVGGIAHVARRCLLAERPNEFRSVAEPLLDWALSLDPRLIRVPWPSAIEPTGRPIPRDPRKLSLADGDRESIALATARLFEHPRSQTPTAASIRVASGLSRRRFDDAFTDTADAVLDAARLRSAPMLRAAAAAMADATSWEAGVRDALAVVTTYCGKDAALARLAMVAVLDAGPGSFPRRNALIASAAERLRRAGPPGRLPPVVVTEAAVAGVWLALRHGTVTGRTDRPPDPGALAFVLTAGGGGSVAVGATPCCSPAGVDVV